MNDITYRNVYLDGNKKTSGNTSNFNCLINNNDGFFNTESNEKYYERIECIPEKFKIMNDFYNISSSGNLINNQFGFVVSSIINPTNLDAVKLAIPSGYWNVYNLLDWLNENIASELNTTINFITGDANEYNYTVSIDYNNDENKYTFDIDVDNNFYNTYTLKMVFQDTTAASGNLEFTGTCEQFLGCLKNTQLGMNGSPIYSPYTLNFLAYPEIYIYSNIVLSNRENTDTGVINSNLLMILDNDEPKLSYFNFQNSSDLFLTECRNNIQSFDFSITDKDKKPIDFLSYPQIYLRFKKYRIYRENKIESILDNILKLQELNTLYNKFNKPNI